MLSYIIRFSLRNKILVFLFTSCIIGFGLYALSQIPIGAVPDVTNNQVQVITTSRNLATEDMEQFITYPVELEMANLPGVKEIRSISKFGLSVVTIVFEDDMGTYLPRQLIAEKIKSASEKIPEGFGTPEMGPITTGLGEIYQYILDVEPEYKDQYDAEDLRTIQDWIVKRQLSGIPGVVEVNTWGGFLKQYEVAINTNKLNAMDITATEVFRALEQNNSVSGGGYIEKVNQAYFIRGEGLISSLKDIEDVVVVNKNGVPIFIKDVAQVAFGNAVRFGAITGNGEGEKVLGQVMMLKDANSKKVIDAVKERVAEISKSLPEGVYINAFLDRSELIGKTTFTVSENLILGCLIVIFVVVLLLGNWRSGLLVTSVIPLSFLFAISLMYVFGVDANLMSLGAIDFGIIIDGAVIVVEFIAFNITRKYDDLLALGKSERQEFKDNLVFSGASKMMNSAIFGQLIILIVFIPILTLSGVEGKMFRPMVLTFCFTLLGAILLGFTFVPVAASLVLKPSKKSDRNIAVRLMKWIQRGYEPIIDWALRGKQMVMTIALVLLAIAVYVYTLLGAEFVPTLDEGDFVIQPVLKTGTSLTKTVETTTKIEEILLNRFPEVKQVVTRIGAAEVPTDPMSMEESDVIITLKPKGEWTSASSKDELADKFKEALAVIPGIEVEFTQPIEMRFNELITGVRADIAIKIFGENLEILAKKGNEIGNLIADVPGAADITVEKVDGLPEMNVRYDRSKVARYGLNIQELNTMLSMGFAGSKAGSVFEGEKRFDLVVRLQTNKRKDIDNLRNLYIDLPNGGKVPLSELAVIEYKTGAAKISRDDTRRRIVVGVNVRGRDLQSVVSDVQGLMDQHITLPVGYTITYGGQFENLESAKSRLLVAVPIALILIFMLLYFALSSVKEALMIYSAIPLAAVGGVFLLWIRDMPFSISAGVGFIALFGIVVLNGIILIEHFKDLKAKEYNTIDDLVKQGTLDRLRAVMLTASSTALGFLPMAISTSAGAEVQRPLATVVIGGLISATLLTLVVLPVLFAYLNRKRPEQNTPATIPNVGLTLFILLLSLPLFSQETPKTLQELLPMALENNAGLKASSLEVEQSDVLLASAFSFDKTQVYYQFDENNLTLSDAPLRVFGIQQDFRFPTVYFSERKLNKAKYSLSENSYEIQEKGLERRLTSAYYNFQLARERERVYDKLDSIYSNFAKVAARRFELGETNYLEKITAAAKQQQIHLNYKGAQKEVLSAYATVLTTIQAKESIALADERVLKVLVRNTAIENTPEIDFYQNRIAVSEAEKRFEKQQLLPDIGLEYFSGTTATTNERLSGYQLGLKIPLLFGGTSSRIKAAGFAADIAVAESEEYTVQLKTKLQTLQTELSQLQETLDYYENAGNSVSEEILKTADVSFRNGEIDFYQYIQSLESAYGITLDYLEKLQRYNETAIAINYLTL